MNKVWHIVSRDMSCTDEKQKTKTRRFTSANKIYTHNKMENIILIHVEQNIHNTHTRIQTKSNIE